MVWSRRGSRLRNSATNVVCVVCPSHPQSEIGRPVSAHMTPGVALQGVTRGLPLRTHTNGFYPEDEKEVNVSFPENYHVKDLAGAPVVFKVKVHEVKTKVLPELDDEFAKDVNAQGVETIEQLKEHIKSNLTNDKTKAAEDKALNELMTKVVDGVKVDIPEGLLE